MNERSLLNLDALLELIVGLLLLMNPLLGPKLPIPSGIVSLVGVLTLVLAMFLGQSGMGKGRFVGKLRSVGAANIAFSVCTLAWSLLGLDGGGQVVIGLISVTFIAVGVAQVTAASRPVHNPRTSTGGGRRRATPEELRRALDSKNQQ